MTYTHEHPLLLLHPSHTDGSDLFRATSLCSSYGEPSLRPARMLLGESNSRIVNVHEHLPSIFPSHDAASGSEEDVNRDWVLRHAQNTRRLVILERPVVTRPAFLSASEIRPLQANAIITLAAQNLAGLPDVIAGVRRWESSTAELRFRLGRARRRSHPAPSNALATSAALLQKANSIAFFVGLILPIYVNILDTRVRGAIDLRSIRGDGQWDCNLYFERSFSLLPGTSLHRQSHWGDISSTEFVDLEVARVEKTVS
jgi:hypothetical protein